MHDKTGKTDRATSPGNPSPKSSRRKFYLCLSLAALVAVMALGTLLLRGVIAGFTDGPGAREAFRSQGIGGYLSFLGMQVAQVVFALIPGEPLELLAGCAFGAGLGFALCQIGVLIGSTVVFLLVRRAGRGAAGVLMGETAYRKLSFLLNESRLPLTLFLLYLIPGTPKDLLTYFAGLTSIRFGPFLLLTTVARTPSVLSSVLVGSSLMAERFTAGAILLGGTAVLGLGGALLYRRYLRARHCPALPPGAAVSEETEGSEGTARPPGVADLENRAP